MQHAVAFGRLTGFTETLSRLFCRAPFWPGGCEKICFQTGRYLERDQRWELGCSFLFIIFCAIFAKFSLFGIVLTDFGRVSLAWWFCRIGSKTLTHSSDPESYTTLLSSLLSSRKCLRYLRMGLLCRLFFSWFFWSPVNSVRARKTKSMAEVKLRRNGCELWPVAVAVGESAAMHCDKEYCLMSEWVCV